MRWSPSDMQFDASQPLPDLAARWRGDHLRHRVERRASEVSLMSSIRGIARALLGRGIRAAEVLLGVPGEVDASGADASGDPSTVTPFGVMPGTPAIVPPEAMMPGAMAPMTIMPGVGALPADRVVLPMSSGVNVRPGEPVSITSRPQNMAFRPERIVIGGNPSDWVVSEIKIGRRSQLCDSGDLPGEVFATDAEGVNVCLDVVMTAQNFTMEVTYIGPNPEGAPFSCAAMGSAAFNMPPDHTNRIYLPLSSGVAILPGSSAEIHVTPQDPFRPERIVIGGRPENWVVNDIRVGMRSQLAQNGDIPGLAFSATSRGTEISFETVQTAMKFAILVTYVGDRPEGDYLRACAIGSVPA